MTKTEQNCKVCGREDGHMAKIPTDTSYTGGVNFDPSVQQYQEYIKSGVEVGEAHNTESGWCCACEYDLIELNHRIDKAVSDYQTDYEQQHIVSALDVQKAELLSQIKGLGCNPENDLETIARIINTLR